jgi:REG-2-like HAD superfamily hydrolase
MASMVGSAPLSIFTNLAKVRVISLDVTGTLLFHRAPVAATYVKALQWARLADPPTVEQFGNAYKRAYKENSLRHPCFGAAAKMPARDWWRSTALLALKYCERHGYTERELNRFFRKCYQYFGSEEGYALLPDAVPFLKWASSQKNPDATPKFVLGVVSNTPRRVMETVLPMMRLDHYFQWFVCSEDYGFEKPDVRMYDEVFELSKEWLPDLTDRSQILHIGDSLAADYCGSKAAGFQALHLDRSTNRNVVVYQDWLREGFYLGKSEAEIEQNTVQNLNEVRELLTASAIHAPR